MTQSLDHLVATAVRGTARRLEVDAALHGLAQVGEIKHQTPAFRAALTDAGASDVQTASVKLQIRSWEPAGVNGRLGAFDVVIGATEFRALFELKWATHKHELGWTLWDIYKLAAARIEYGAATYAIVGAPVTYWQDGAVDCSALYCDGRWDSAELFRRHRRAWAHLLLGGTARPLRVPSSITTTIVAAERLDVMPEWELRALAIEAGDEEWLDFAGDWPAGHRLPVEANDVAADA